MIYVTNYLKLICLFIAVSIFIFILYKCKFIQIFNYGNVFSNYYYKKSTFGIKQKKKIYNFWLTFKILLFIIIVSFIVMLQIIVLLFVI
jgi:hypothetical protein